MSIENGTVPQDNCQHFNEEYLMSSIKIKKDTSLRKAILQAAITGKLNSDVEGETETGKQLLDRIIEERKKMSHGLDFANAKSGKRKSKKETALAGSNPCDIPEDEIPFEIPENWCWCRLGEIIDLLSGRDLEPSEYNSLSKGIPYMTGASNFENEKLIINRWTDKPATISRLGDLLITCKGTIGELAINHVGDIHIARQIMAIQNTDFISLSFLKFFLISRVDKIQRQAKSMIPGISREDMLGFLFPLPPLAVQNAIVAKLEEVLPLVDAYENAVLQKEELKNALPDTLKKAILQEAIQGKLTEEWRIEMLKQVQHDGRTEETGKQLLDRIIEERKKMSHGLDFANAKSGKRKSKKETALAGSNPCDIPEDEIPFEIPESWCWCRIEDITTFIGGKNNQIQAKEILKEGKIPVVSQGQSLIDGYSNETQKVINNIPVIMFGDHTRNVKYIDFPFVIGADGTKFLKPILCNEKYIYYLVYFIAQNLRNRGYARHYSLLKEEYLPLPPLAEQKKIVEIIEQMLPLCEKLGG